MRSSHRIALAYLILSILWILLSDQFLYVLFPDHFHTISLYKGWAFVTASACVLFVFLRREECRRDSVESQLQQTSITDSLTGLRNRAALISHLDHALKTAIRLRGTFGLVFIDVDDFKTVNDQKGHIVGDDYLKAIAQRISENVRSSDIPARFGGDEFVVYAPNGDDLTVLAHRLLDAFNEPVIVKGEAMKASISIGVARYPENGDSIDSILVSADQAMYSAKQSGKGCVRESS